MDKMGGIIKKTVRFTKSKFQLLVNILAVLP